jgi:hypothetical protein
VPAASLPPTTSLADTLAQRRALREQQQQVVTAAAATGAGAAAGSAAVSAVVRARFRRYDDDNDGRLNRAEVARVLEDLLPTTTHVHTVSGGGGSQRGQRRTGVLQSVDTVMAAFGVFDYRAAAGAAAGAAAAESGVGGIGGAGIGTTRSLLSEQGVLTVEGFQQLWDTAISMDHAAPAAQPDRAAAGGGGGGGVFSLGTMSRSSSSAATGGSAAQLQPPPSPVPTPAPGGGRGGGGGGRGAHVTGLTPAQFARYDLDGDGLLNIDELAAFLEAVSLTAAAAGGGAGGGSSSSLPHPLPRGYLMGLIGQFCGTGTTAAGAAAAEGVGRTELPRLLSFLFSDK